MSHLSLNRLNPQQQEAVLKTDGAILILAGAGSGKTMTLVYKVAYLILEKKISPDSILMVTFTNKAASEMKDRIKTLLNQELQTANCELPFTGTFHSLCAQLLRREGNAIGIAPSFVIYDESDKKEAIKQVMAEKNISIKNIHPAAVGATISGAKNELIGADDYPTYARGFFQETVAEIFIAYQKLLSRNQALDFDDLIAQTVQLFQEHSDILNRYQNRFVYVLVDEYQDTNHAQYVLTRQVSGKWNNICVVGDASQSIYSWRGANFRNILNFKNDHPETRVFHLEKNYRSTQTILDAAFGVISKNNSHPILKLWTDKVTSEKINLFEAGNEHDEARFIIDTITTKSLLLEESVVLYRTNAQSRVIEEVFLHTGIPYLLIGGVNFYERKEIKDILSYLRLLINPDESVSRSRIEKLGKRRFETFETFLRTVDKKMIEETPTSTLLDQVLDKSQYLSHFDIENEEDLSRLENIKELRSVALEFSSLVGFLENVSLVEREAKRVQKKNEEKPTGRITLMTLHSAKGLEFTNVFLVGMEEGIFPHSRSLLDSEQLEEERRLCYVGITRAKEYICLSYARKRLFFGTRTTNMPSRFINDIPEELIEHQHLIW